MQDLSQTAGDNICLPFQIERNGLRGRIIQLGDVLDRILAKHGYPDEIEHLLAEVITLSAVLASMLKYEGVFILQAQGDGPVSMVMSDVTSEGHIRGCATFDEDKLRKMSEGNIEDLPETGRNNRVRFFGKGYLAFTVDQRYNTDRYQGIVSLGETSLMDAVQHYFDQSEQIGTALKLAVGKRNGKWRAGALMLQHMPEDEKTRQDNQDGTLKDDWDHIKILTQSCKIDELLDPSLSAERLLYRLYHEDGVRVYEAKALIDQCRCSEDKIKNVLDLLPIEDLEEMIKDGPQTITCEFCSKVYDISVDDIQQRLTPKD